MIYKKRYRHQFDNVEGKRIITMIDDTKSGPVNPYNVTIEDIDLGGGIVLIRIFFNNIPAAATGLQFSYSDDGGSTWNLVAGTGMVSPKEFSVPNTTQYLYRMLIIFPDAGDNILVELSELEPTVIDLPAAGDPYHLITNNSSRQKSGIVGMQAVIQFLSSSEVNIKTFLDGAYDDQRYLVTSYVDDPEFVFFRGFLAMSESRDSFMPHPVNVTLTAVDGLGFLKNIPLTDFTGNTPENEQRIIDFIAWCLAKTGLQQNISVIMNIREEDDGTLTDEPNSHFYVTQYLDTKTFEDEPGTCENCYTALEKILGKCCILGQRHGNWWIKNTDEYDTQPDYVAEFDYLGNLLGMREGAYYIKNIGSAHPRFFSQEREEVSFFNPNKFGKINYKFETPKEVPANIDFTRGAYIADIDANSKKYELNDWEKLWSSPTGDLPGTAGVYVRRNFINGSEKELFVVIPSTPGEFNFIMSREIPVHAGDKFNLGVQMRLNTNPGGSGFRRSIGVQTRLYADDGTFYTHHGLTSIANDRREWVECTSDFLTNQKHFCYEYYAEDDISTSPVSLYDGESAPLPKKGKLRILLFANSLELDTKDTFLNASFEYIPYINGAFHKFSGISHKVEQVANNNETYDEQVYVSDGYKQLFKGTLMKLGAPVITYEGTIYFIDGKGFSLPGYQLTKFRAGQTIVVTTSASNNITSRIVSVEYSIALDTTTITVEAFTTLETVDATISVKPFILSERFWNAAVFDSGVPSDDYYHPYAYIIAFNLWNQKRTVQRIFTGMVQGIDTGVLDDLGRVDLMTIFHTYLLTDADDHTSNKKFMLLDYDMDLRLCELASHTLAEVVDTAVGKKYADTDSYEFKYLTN